MYINIYRKRRKGDIVYESKSAAEYYYRRRRRQPSDIHTDTFPELFFSFFFFSSLCVRLLLPLLPLLLNMVLDCKGQDYNKNYTTCPYATAVGRNGTERNRMERKKLRISKENKNKNKSDRSNFVRGRYQSGGRGGLQSERIAAQLLLDPSGLV